MPPKQPNQTRTWGTRYDTLPSSPPVSPEVKQGETQLAPRDTDSSPESQGIRQEDKQPHDASVFVGSLPSNVDQAELTRLLTNHLSEHTEIKGIKVIRDSKGGVCAFVQCEDAVSASTFLKSLQNSSPKPFLGRILRYEPARAFRTLLISYRIPFQVMTPEGSNRISMRAMADVLQLDLPNAIRIWKPKNTKYHRIVYNGEAIEAERFARSLAKDEVTPVNEEAVFLQPLRFDAESIVEVARHFGPLENISCLTESHELVKAPKNGILGPECYPPPHNAARSKGMDTSCWEVKWNHRDDCVAALMVLRRVSYLSVSWAHQPQTQHLVHRTHSHIQDYQPMVNTAARAQTKADRFQPYNSPGFNPPSVLTPFNSEASPPPLSLRQNVALEDNRRTVLKSATVFGDEIGSWVEPMTPSDLTHKPINNSSDVGGKSVDPPLPTRIDWADSDFPSFVDSEYDSKLDWSVWDETSFERDMVGAPSMMTSQSVREVSTPQRVRLSSPLLRGDEIPTPGLAMSPPTSRATLSQAPATPINQSFGAPFSSFKSRESVIESSNPATLSNREFDPTALFVGGLEMLGPDAWTQEKVEAFFGRFRGLLHVKFVCPPNGHAAFAFIKYDNTESPAQAIMQEHNRVYAGRALKVQLRDTNPPRSPWKPSRGRGRFAHYHQSRKVMLSNRPLSYIPKQEGPSPRQSFLENGVCTTTAFSPSAPTDKSDSDDESNPVNKQQKEGPVARVLENTQVEKYREWYDAPGAVSIPEPASASGGSTGPPLVAPALPYPVPPGYYPMPWIPFAQPGHYQMSYYGPYTTYPPGPPMPPHPTTPPGSDTNGPTVGTMPWPNMMYTPYAPCFAPPRSVMDQQSPPPANLGPQFTQPSQAPLAPSGFIQSDQGTLVAVYPSDALDQYMSGHGNGSNGSSSTSTSTPSISTTSTWPSAQTITGSTSTLSMPPQAGSNPHLIHPVPATHPLWNPVPPPLPPMPPGIVPGPATPTYNVNAAARTGDPHDHSGANSPSANFAKKQGSNRRNLHLTQNNNRNSRSFNHARNGRGHIHSQHLIGNTEGVNSHYRNPQFGNNSDWNQYTRR